MVALAMLMDTETLSDGRMIKVARAKPRIEVVVPAPMPVEVEEEPKRQRAVAVVYAENRLRPWRDWIREHRQNLGYPTISLLYKAMRRKAIRLRTMADEVKVDDDGNPVGLLTAMGKETLSMRPASVGECSDAIAETDQVVAELPEDLHRVIIADYLTYGGIEIRCRATPWKRARYSQLLECAKYAVYQGLRYRPCF